MLPSNPTPVYTLQIPSTGKELKYRPFLVKEEKALLIAQQSEDSTVLLDTVKDVIKACAKSSVDVNTLASFDIEYIFLRLRAMSVGEIVDLIFRCDDCTDDKAKSLVQVNLMDVKIEKFENHQSKIPLFGEVGVVMKYPNIETLKKLDKIDQEDVDHVIDIASDCIDYIYDSDEIFLAKDQSKEDLVEFINNLTAEQFKKLELFFRTIPSLRVYVQYDCPLCKKHHNKYMEGLQSFF